MRLDDERLWQQYYEGTAAAVATPNNYDGGNKVYDVPVGVTEFQKIMISQILRPDQMVGVMMKSAAKILGKISLKIFIYLLYIFRNIFMFMKCLGRTFH